MNVRRFLIAILFLAPSAALIIAIVLHKPNDNYILITANQLRQTQAIWTNEVYSPIETNAQFAAKLKRLRITKNGAYPSTVELAALRQSVSNLVLANYLGDYDVYRKFRLPVEGYKVSYEDENVKKGWDAYFRALFPNTPVPTSFDEIDHQIWTRVFGKHHYWLAIALDNSSISLAFTNQIPGTLGIDVLDPSMTHCMESVTTGTYSYRNILESILMKHGKLLVAKLNFMVDTVDPPKTPRPVLYVLAFYPDADVWLPIGFAQCSTAGSKYPPPF